MWVTLWRTLNFQKIVIDLKTDTQIHRCVVELSVKDSAEKMSLKALAEGWQCHSITDSRWQTIPSPCHSNQESALCSCQEWRDGWVAPGVYMRWWNEEGMVNPRLWRVKEPQTEGWHCAMQALMCDNAQLVLILSDTGTSISCAAVVQCGQTPVMRK